MPPIAEAQIAVITAVPLLAAGIDAHLGRRRNLRSAGTWTDVRSALENWQNTPPDIAILDHAPASHATPDSVQTIAEQTAVLLLADHLSTEGLHLALHLGARGAVPRDALPSTVVLAVRDVLTTGRHIPETCRAELADRLLRGRLPSYLHLTRREREILHHAVTGMSSPAIAAALVLSPATVKTHLRTAYRKLGARDRETARIALTRLGVMVPTTTGATDVAQA